MADSFTIQGWIAEAEQARHDLATGKQFIQLWRDGRRAHFSTQKLAELDAYIQQLKGELVTQQIAEGQSVQRRRRPIGLAWRN